MENPEQSATTYKSARINVLLAVAYVTVLLCLIVTVWVSEMGEYAQGVITLVLGRFLGYTDQVYSFEFGTTSTSKAKDESIANLTAAATPASTTTVTTTKSASPEQVNTDQPTKEQP